MVRSTEALRIDLVDVLGPGGTRREPSALGHHLHPTDGSAVAGRGGEDGLDPLASQITGPDVLGRECLQQRLLFGSGGCLNAVVDRFAELACELAVDLARIAAHARRDLRREQGRDDAVFVRCPDAAVQTNERRACALFAAEAKRSVEQAVHEPLEADRHLVEPPAELRGDAIDHLAAHHVLPTAASAAPRRSVLEEIEDGHRQIVIRRQQPRAARDDPMPVMVRVTGKGDRRNGPSDRSAAASHRARMGPCESGRPNRPS